MEISIKKVEAPKKEKIVSAVKNKGPKDAFTIDGLCFPLHGRLLLYYQPSQKIFILTKRFTGCITKTEEACIEHLSILLGVKDERG